jgi:hypothetical protein
MSSSKATRKTKSVAGKSKPSNGETTPAAKAAFAKAMYDGIRPGTKTARSIAVKKSRPEEAEPKVEVLRRIAAPQPVQENEESAYILQLANDIDKAIQSGDLERFSPQAQQALMGSLCRLYAANNENGNHFSVLGPQSGVSATDAMILCGAMLKAVDLQVFELGLWLSWSSR